MSLRLSSKCGHGDPTQFTTRVRPVARYGLHLRVKVNTRLAIEIQIPANGILVACKTKRRQGYGNGNVDTNCANKSV